MRTSGRGSDLSVLLVPMAVLLVMAVALAGDNGKILATAEKQLWGVAHSVGSWVASLFS